MVATEFAPPFKLIAPYFLIGVISLLVSIVSLFNIDINSITHLNHIVVGIIHFFLLSFVMMIIFGAMAQLVPVVLEVGHFAVDLYYVIYPLLFIGSIIMGFGFIYYPAILPYGGVVVLISLLIFIFETIMTIFKVKKFNTIINSLIVANIFLLTGLIFGIIIALTYSGSLDFDILNLLRGHIYLVLFGYVFISIMGISMVLLPMFWLSHSFSWKPVQVSIILTTIGVIFEVISAVTINSFFEYVGYVTVAVAVLSYFYQIYIIYKTRVRIEKDIYKNSLIVSYLSLIFGLFLGIAYLATNNQKFILTFGWVSLFGFVMFLIAGHLYKIIPFLVWYHRFSALVGKQKVPMLTDMVPTKSANMQFFYNLIGFIFTTLSLMIGYEIMFKAGISFLLIGSTFLIKDIFYMINYKI